MCFMIDISFKIVKLDRIFFYFDGEDGETNITKPRAPDKLLGQWDIYTT